VTEVQVEAIAGDWLKAIRQLPGGAAVKMRVFFPVVNSRGGETDFYFVMNTPTFTDWGKIWDAYSDDSAAAKSEDLNQGKVVCPDSVLWEAHEVVANGASAHRTGPVRAATHGIPRGSDRAEGAPREAWGSRP
jgi:hypothetical protein